MTEWPTFEADGVTLINGDCLEVMPTLEPGSVDLILADLPYGTTACKWDTVIPFEPLWNCYKRVLKPRGAVVLTASQPFTSMLVMSNREWFKYTWTWDKINRITGFLDSKKRPLRVKEDLCVFSEGQPTYNPQMVQGEPYSARRGKRGDIYGTHRSVDADYLGERYPQDIIRIKADSRGKEGRTHPTQKPVELFEYLIKTYSNEGETVLDNTIGSGTTAVACQNTGRKCIGIERDPGYFATAIKRVQSAQLPLLASTAT